MMRVTAMDTATFHEDLQVDVREYLKARTLPCTSQGARQALVDLGVWSSSDIQDNDDDNNNNNNSRRDVPVKPQPWSPEILEAVEWYRSMDSKRKARLAQNLHRDLTSSSQTTTSSADTILEGRIDLTHLPCICIDAARTSFRDDAIGVRPRVSTGRDLIGSAKWEILLHTVDVSDLYAPAVVQRAKQLELLQSAASKRGISRYDLPTGPLHLLPPALLETLALDVAKHSSVTPQRNLNLLNRCATTWVYMDGTTGRILDSGMERTLISAPLALTFQEASDILDGDGEKLSGDLKKAQTLLKLLERDVLKWKDTEKMRSPSSSSKTREDRLVVREEIDALIFGDTSRDDGREGFKRTRGHRLVDACLDLQGFALTNLVRRSNHNLPFVAGAQRDGRVATAPLRRYIDGVAQWQALAVLCGYGGEPYSREECAEIGLQATKAVNSVLNIQSFKTSASAKSSGVSSGGGRKQQQAARELQHLLSTGAREQDTFSAVSTGKHSEVVIVQVGAVAFCEGIQGTLKPGAKILVSVRDIDLGSGRIRVAIVDSITGQPRSSYSKQQTRTLRKKT